MFQSKYDMYKRAIKDGILTLAEGQTERELIELEYAADQLLIQNGERGEKSLTTTSTIRRDDYRMETSIEDISEEIAAPITRVETEDPITTAREALRQSGTKVQRLVFEHWHTGHNQTEVAKLCQITQGRVSQILQEVSQIIIAYACRTNEARDVYESEVLSTPLKQDKQEDRLVSDAAADRLRALGKRVDFLGYSEDHEPMYALHRHGEENRNTTAWKDSRHVARFEITGDQLQVLASEGVVATHEYGDIYLGAVLPISRAEQLENKQNK